MVFRSRKEASCHDLEKKKWFLGQGSRQASMTQRGKLISRSRKQANQHDPEERNGLRVKEVGKSA